MPNTGCQEWLLIQITQEPRLTETPCHHPTVTERVCDQMNTGPLNFHLGVKHTTSAQFHWPSKSCGFDLTSKGQRSAILPCDCKKEICRLVNNSTNTGRVHKCAHTPMCIDS